jgi:hypothetical protein
MIMPGQLPSFGFSSRTIWATGMRVSASIDMLIDNLNGKRSSS